MASFACPVDGTILVPIERQGIEIDHCPSCRGVWLDRGELDKILERSAGAAAPSPQPQLHREQRPLHEDHHHRGGGYYPPKRRKSFFEELFD